MKQSDFYRAMVAGMVVIVIALSFNAYANWTTVECTSVYYTGQVGLALDGRRNVTVGRVIHSCFDHDGNLIEKFDNIDPREIRRPRTPPPGNR